jgi:hypothetical protein
VEDFPLNWIDGTYYSTYKGNTFQVSSIENAKSDAEYDAVTTINLSNQSLTTDFTFLDKFKNLINLLLSDNNINIIDLSKIYNKLLIKNIAIKNNNITICDLQGFNNVESVLIHTNNISEVDFSDLLSVERLEFYTNNISEVDLSNSSNLDILIGFQNNLTNIDLSNNTLLTELTLFSNSITSIDLSNNTLLINCKVQSNDLTDIDLSNNTLLTDVRIHNNELDAATNSQVLIDLDSHGQNNGYLQSTIFGGGSLTSAGQTAKSNLLSKGWTIVGI